MRKNWKVALCVIGCCGSIMMNVYAQDVERDIGACVQKVKIIEPYYTNISNVSVMTKINAGNASSNVEIYSNSIMTISVKLRLEKYTNGYWNTVRSWSTSKRGIKLLFSRNCNVTKGYKYRTVAVVNCGGEKVTKYSNSVSY